MSFWPIDAVVLWDWIISLPREYRFVRSLHAPLFLFLTFSLRYGELIGLQSRLHISSAGKFMRRFDRLLHT